MEYVWLSVILVAVIAEWMTRRHYGAAFVPGAVISMFFAFFGLPLLAQILAFFCAGSLFFCLFLRVFPCTKKTPQVGDTIGEHAVVSERIENLAGAGQVELHGQCWSARAMDDSCVYEAGDVVTVIAVEGVKLICRK